MVDKFALNKSLSEKHVPKIILNYILFYKKTFIDKKIYKIGHELTSK